MKVKSLNLLLLISTRCCLGLLILIPFLMLGTMARAGTSQIAGADANLLQQSKDQQLVENWGIELIAMRSVAAGHMVDFRYRVVDAVKAAPLFVRHNKPYLINQASGKALAVPNTAKVGSLRNSYTPQEGRIYWMFFGNNHKLIQKGDKVTVAIGDFRATDIEVK